MKDILEETLILKQTEKNYIELISKKYGIVDKTLIDKMYKYMKYGDSIISDKKRIHTRMFTDSEEERLANNIRINFIEKHLPFDNEHLKLLAQKFWETHKSGTEYERVFKASDGWCTDFKHRWGFSSKKPSLRNRKYEKDDHELIKKFKEECIVEYNRVTAKYFYNYDETFWTVINKPFSTFGNTGKEPSKIAYLGNEKDGFTAGFTINAEGKFLTPIVIKKGKTERCLKSLKKNDSIQLCYSNNGWINKGIMIKILDLINRDSENNESVLILDQFSVHKDSYVIDEAQKRKIKLVFIPPHLTWKFQPLDVGINGPLKSTARKLWKEERLLDPNKIPTIQDGIDHMYRGIREKINENIVKGSFRNALPFLYDN